MPHLLRTKSGFRKYITEHPRIRVGTLGPSGTSSDHTLDSLLRGLDPHGHEKILYDSFDDVYRRLVDGSIDLAMVPSAYTNSTRFYWAPEFCLVGSLIHKTPDYFFSQAPGREVVRSIATCAAVKHMLVDRFSQWARQPYEMVVAESTVAAAREVAAGRADACITNSNGHRQYHLTAVHAVDGVDMVWSFFRMRS